MNRGSRLEPDRVAPELRGRVRAANLAGAVDHAWSRHLLRAALRVTPASAVSGVAIDVQPGGGLGIRTYRPRAIRSPAALLWIHGGGMVIGRATQNDRLCGDIARTLGIRVVSVEYRKAPEHPFPAPLDDCHAGWAWLQAGGSRLGIDPGRVVIGGESAGGGLAASLVQRLHDEGGAQPIGQLLFCPMLDDRTAARHELDAIDHPVWNNRRNRFGWRSYLGAEPGSASVPPGAVPARRDDLAGLPPAWIGVGDLELFREEGVAYATRLREAGVTVELDVVPGAVHGFEVWAPDTTLAREHLGRACAWLGRTLGLDTPDAPPT
jgi:acetyl esterase/lipase